MHLYAYVHNDPINLLDPDGEKAVAWAVELVKGGLKRTKAFYEKRHAVEARRRGENVQAVDRQMAGQITRGASANPNDIVRHRGHPLKDGSGKVGRPHFQTKGVAGHTFWSIASAAVSALISVLEVVEASDPFNVGCSPGSSGCVGPEVTFGEGNQSQGGSPADNDKSSQSRLNRSSQWSIDGDLVTGTRCTGRIDCARK